MKLAIVGSRTFNDYDLLETTIHNHYKIREISHIVSGGANGADKLGERFAQFYGIPTIIYNPDWKTFKAGFLRNYDIISTADQILAFWDGQSKGTAHDIEIAKQINTH